MRPRFVLLSAMTALSMLLPWNAKADPVLISFDERNPGQYGSSLYTDLTVYLVSFAGGIDDRPLSVYTGFTIAASAQATTPPNVASGALLPNLAGSFFVPVGDFRNLTGYTDFLSFSVVWTDPGQSDAWRVAIYNDMFDLLDSRIGTTNAQVVFIRPQTDVHISGCSRVPRGKRWTRCSSTPP